MAETSMLTRLKFAQVWKAVNKTAADEANDAIRRSLVPAAGLAESANVSRAATGQFAPLRQPKDNKAMAWFRKITDPRQKFEIIKNWSPFQAPVIGGLRITPVLQVEVKPLEYSRVELDEDTTALVVDAIGEALVKDTSWIEPIVNDVANPDPFYTYGNC